MQQKKQLILLILKVLENESDKNHLYTQRKIASIISEVYPCDRKTVGRNIQFLQKLGYPIIKTQKGFYMDKTIFTVEERKFILNAVSMAEGKSADEKESIVFRLSKILNKIYR